MLRLTQAAHDVMVAHCRREYPKEACGILAGHGGSVTQVYPMTNVEASPISYAMSPTEQLQVMKRMRQASQEMRAIYHSHTASAATPSPVDVRLAAYPEVSYVLVSLQDRQHPDVRSYRIQDGAVTPEALQVI